MNQQLLYLILVLFMPLKASRTNTLFKIDQPFFNQAAVDIFENLQCLRFFQFQDSSNKARIRQVFSGVFYGLTEKHLKISLRVP